MQFSSSFIIALMAPLALAAPLPPQTSNASSNVKRDDGTATIHNNCDFDIVVNPVANGASDGFTTVPAGTTWSQQQQNFGGAGQGVSLKVNKVDDSSDNVAQFEYTVNDDMSLLFYDLSLINGNPFVDHMQQLSSGGEGPEVACAAGEQPCSAAYIVPEQVATKAAAQGTNLDYYICSSN